MKQTKRIIEVIITAVLICMVLFAPASAQNSKKPDAVGLYRVTQADELGYLKQGSIDKTGGVISIQYGLAGGFHEGLAAVSVSGRWGYVDKSRGFVINPQFQKAGDLS